MAEEKKKVLPSPDARQIGELTAEMDEMARNHGRLPQGERISRDIAVPRKVGKKKTMHKGTLQGVCLSFICLG